MENKKPSMDKKGSLANMMKQTAKSFSAQNNSIAKNIPIDLIDFDEKNEFLNGYEDQEKLEESINEIGMLSVIGVYKKNDDSGRYLCYSGHSRLKALISAGKDVVPCYIKDEPENEIDKTKNLILMNIQRQKRPLYFARNLKEYESILRKEGNKNPFDVITKQYGISKVTYYRYMKILKLSDELQQLCATVDFPYSVLVDNAESMGIEEQHQLYDIVLKKQSVLEDTITSSELKELIDNIKNKGEIEAIKDVVQKETEPVEKKSAYVHTACKRFLKLKENDLSNIIKDHDKSRTLVCATELRDYLNEIIKYCQE